MDDRNIKGQFNPGNTIGGRPRSGRSIAIQILDKICAESETLELFETSLRERLQKNPLGFYREFVVALAPKEMDIGLVDVGFATFTPDEEAKIMDSLTVGDNKKE